MNIHDFGVHPDFRGLGIAKKLLSFISNFAQTEGFCKITLEVLQGNAPAHALYVDQGFSSYELNPVMGGAIMMQKNSLRNEQMQRERQGDLFRVLEAIS